MKNPQGGQATVELAFCLPFVALLIAVVLEICLLGTDQIRLWNAAREAARLATVQSDEAAIREAATAGGPERVAITMHPPAGNRTQGGTVTVRLIHRPKGHVPLVRALVSRLTLRADATMRIEQP
ncbi:MAG TPA: TadE family protein [Actinomycetota bacterium]|nr:TadE family protein [Actinomycetota bacterium]